MDVEQKEGRFSNQMLDRRMEHTFQTFLYQILDNRNQPRNENGMEYSIFKDRIPYKIENGPVVLKYRHMDHS